MPGNVAPRYSAQNGLLMKARGKNTIGGQFGRSRMKPYVDAKGGRCKPRSTSPHRGVDAQSAVTRRAALRCRKRWRNYPPTSSSSVRENVRHQLPCPLACCTISLYPGCERRSAALDYVARTTLTCISRRIFSTTR